MRVDSILKIWCSKCQAVNYINQGDTTDLTVADPDGVECRSCHHREVWDEDELMTDDSEFATLAEFIAETCSFEIGKEMP